MPVRKIAMLSLLTTIIYVGRIAFQFLPNVQPMTVILMMITLVFGFKEGAIVAVLSILVSNINLGMGIWTIPQIISYIILIALTSLFSNSYKEKPIWVIALYSGFLGMLYGLVISILQAPFFGFNIFIPYYLSGIPFDFLHSVGNIVFYFILSPSLLPIIENQYNKNTLH